ncbi:MAG: molybdopterin-dependent oxidoreductase, partial [Chloroflexota bacterium]
MIKPDKTVLTTCPYCGVGCQMNINIQDDYIYSIEAPFDAAPNYGMLCVKGRFGTDYVNHPDRIKKPLIRTNRAEGRSAKPKWREASWDEALDYVADELVRISKSHGGDAIASYASAKATNEDNYVY